MTDIAPPASAGDAAEPPAYDPAAIEQKWQAYWDTHRTNSPDLVNAPNPYYALMMFPYPSAEGLHVGNLFAFTGNDVHARYQRMRGNTVFEPFGYDAFGIHSENYAIKVGMHPAELIPRNIGNFRRQILRGGLMIDWTHELSTTDADYYRWTQWVFLQLYRKGLAYKKKGAVNWCPFDKTVLANEQVENGKCERCGTAVEQRFLEQWFFRITDYAERLLKNLDTLDWSDSTKTAQRNWIGKSEGAELVFTVQDLLTFAGGAMATAGMSGEITSSPMVVKVFTTRPDTIFGATYLVLSPEHPLVSVIATDDQRDEVSAYIAQSAKQDLIARKTSKEKTGVFTGAYAVNPATQRPIPIWIADYVLMEYGTGAIMAVPAHDERDFEFAHKFDLTITRVVSSSATGRDTALQEAFTESAGCHLVNSGRFNGMPVEEGKRAIVTELASHGAAEHVTNYRLHDWCISRQRYWGPPIPVVYCDACGVVPVPEDQLPVLLPAIDDFRPDDSGISPLARHEEWFHTPCPTCGKTARRETDVSDTFLDSAWYFLRYPSSDCSDVPFDAALTKKWLPVTTYIGGNEHAVLHLLYSRFTTMVLHDMGKLDFEEPFTKFRAHGLIVKDGAKMSKSKGNIVNPDEYMNTWGADAFRTYLMFLGPFEEGGDFRDAGISGVKRFLDRLWLSAHEAQQTGDVDPDVKKKVHRTIRKVTDDIPKLSYNTAIAAMMECMNTLRSGERVPHLDEVRPLVQMVAPFAPHMAEELWSLLGGMGTVFDAGWPAYDESQITEERFDMPVQVNGKRRGTISVATNVSQADALAMALADPAVAKFVTGTPKKVIFVPGRLLSIVV